ncbi:MAG TPA: PA2778 family cysteine peptidase [Noviherbaspirillum sp.]|nr:PA2778 family cysteine peptidase [Noviherbaspirillum sp.]
MQGAILRPRQRWLPGVFLVLVLLLSGCATQTHNLLQGRDASIPPRQELVATPFFPQELYQCGPASLATVLQVAGVSATPEQLVSQVYIPERQGSLQTEMIAAARRHGTLAVTIPPRLDALLQEVANGTPVIVLQNLSLPVQPVWHYAVVIGYDLDRREVVLRSGTTEREVMPMRTFEHTWARSNHWAMVAMPAGRLPATAAEDEVAPALVALERVAKPEQAHAAYAAALQRWPDNLILLMGAGNAAYRMGKLDQAATALRRATTVHPDSAPAFNNLANVLIELGDYDSARVAAERAVALGGQWSSAAQATLETVRRRQMSGL